MFKDDNDTLLLCDKHKVLPLQRPCTVSSPSSWQTGESGSTCQTVLFGQNIAETRPERVVQSPDLSLFISMNFYLCWCL